MGPAVPTLLRRITVIVSNRMFATSPSIAGPVVISIVGALSIHSCTSARASAKPASFRRKVF
jgi:hypothetical protein